MRRPQNLKKNPHFVSAMSLRRTSKDLNFLFFLLLHWDKQVNSNENKEFLPQNIPSQKIVPIKSSQKKPSQKIVPKIFSQKNPPKKFLQNNSAKQFRQKNPPEKFPKNFKKEFKKKSKKIPIVIATHCVSPDTHILHSLPPRRMDLWLAKEEAQRALLINS